jgi:ATP-binding cassette, subfamily F, member 2
MFAFPCQLPVTTILVLWWCAVLSSLSDLPDSSYPFFVKPQPSPPLLTTMVSDASKKKAAKRGAKVPTPSSSSSADAKSIGAVAALKLSDRTCTGVLASHPLSRDIHVSIPVFPRSIHFLDDMGVLFFPTYSESKLQLDNSFRQKLG